MTKNIQARSKGERILFGVCFVLFSLYALTLIFPFAWCFISSFKKSIVSNLWGLPKVWRWENWSEALSITVKTVSVPGMFFNSMVFVSVGTVLSIASCSLTAYTISKYRFKCRSFLYVLALVIMMVPTMGSLASTYRMYVRLGLYNTYFGIFVMYLNGFGGYFLFLYGFFVSLPWTYAEAAMVDGASHLRVFLQIMLPIAMPALGAVGILCAIGIWNDYFTVYLFAPQKATIAVGLNYVQNAISGGSIRYPHLFALIILSTLPILAIFIVFQKTIMDRMALGGIKG